MPRGRIALRGTTTSNSCQYFFHLSVVPHCRLRVPPCIHSQPSSSYSRSHLVASVTACVPSLNLSGSTGRQTSSQRSTTLPLFYLLPSADLHILLHLSPLHSPLVRASVPDHPGKSLHTAFRLAGRLCRSLNQPISLDQCVLPIFSSIRLTTISDFTWASSDRVYFHTFWSQEINSAGYCALRPACTSTIEGSYRVKAK